MMEKIKNIFQSLNIKKIGSILWWVLVIVLVLILGKVIIAKAKGDVPKVFGYSIMKIVSGSMEPEIKTGSYILIKTTKLEKIKQNDIICFISEDPVIYGIPNTHRVMEIIELEDGKYEFVTKGDANVINDKINAKGENVIGKYVKTINSLNFVNNIFNGNGMFIVLIIIQGTTVGFIIYSIYKKKDKVEEENNK